MGEALADLKSTVKDADQIQNEWIYTDKSYSAFSDALSSAKTALKDTKASASDLSSAASKLRTAQKNLVKSGLMTRLNIHVTDKNGNIFARKFKFQVVGSGFTAYNIWTDPETGTAAFTVPKGWKDGTTAKLLPCTMEAYDFDKPIEVTTGAQPRNIRLMLRHRRIRTELMIRPMRFNPPQSLSIHICLRYLMRMRANIHRSPGRHMQMQKIMP